MRPVASINGKPVYSDKAVASVVNSRVMFADGSWCDVQSGHVENRGPGFISLNTPPESSGPIAPFVQKQFRASTLSISGISERVTIELSDHDMLTVDAKGIDEKDLIIRCANDEVQIREAKIARGSRLNFGSVSMDDLFGTIFGNASKIVAGDVRVGGRGEASSELIIRVPKGTRLNISNVTGGVHIGDVEGDLVFHSNTLSDAHFGTMGSVHIVMGGTGSVSVKSVVRQLDVELSGVGDVKVKGGNVDNLKIVASGIGSAMYNGRARRAVLSATGVGSVMVHHVDERPSVRSTFTAKVSVGNW